MTDDTAARDVQWEPIKGWEGVYEITPSGLVRSVERSIVDSMGRTQRFPSKALSPRANQNGYLVFHFRDGANGRRAMPSLHRLLAVQFISNPDGKPCVNHIDHDRRNNALSNLEWCTQAENLQHARDAGRMRIDQLGGVGESNGRARLTWHGVMQARCLKSSGWSYGRLAEKYGVNKITIMKAVTGESWSPPPPEPAP